MLNQRRNVTDVLLLTTTHNQSFHWEWLITLNLLAVLEKTMNSKLQKSDTYMLPNDHDNEISDSTWRVKLGQTTYFCQYMNLMFKVNNSRPWTLFNIFAKWGMLTWKYSTFKTFILLQYTNYRHLDTRHKFSHQFLFYVSFVNTDIIMAIYWLISTISLQKNDKYKILHSLERDSSCHFENCWISDIH